MNIVLILLAAGNSNRLNSSKPKPYIVVNHKSIIEHTIDNFKKIKNIKKIVLTYNKKHKKELNKLNIQNIIKIPGGRTRSQSTLLSLKKIKKLNYKKVLIHDVARPNTSINLIKKVINQLKFHKAVIPAIKPTDSIKLKKQRGLISEINRTNILMTQTPQGFSYKEIMNLHESNNNQNIHDDASLFIQNNKKIKIVDGEKENFKITNLQDLRMLKKIKYNSNVFFGIGFDVHRLIKGRKLYLGGVNIPYHSGLKGHSDGDPVLHALIDSLLGASNLGDIGTLFSNKNSKYKNIRSTKLLIKVINLINNKNFLINNIDINIIAERPSIKKYKNKMITLISKMCKIQKKQINIKGKTTEKLGIIGKEKAIASEVIASLIKKNE